MVTADLDRKPMSWAEYEALGTEVRAEYVDGELVVSPGATGRTRTSNSTWSACCEPPHPKG
jgi:hypothetical protein